MTREFVMTEMAKVGLAAFKRYLWSVYRVSFETFGDWSKADKERALMDFFGGNPA